MIASAFDGRSMTDAWRALSIHSSRAPLILLASQRAELRKLGMSSSPQMTKAGAVILAAAVRRSASASASQASAYPSPYDFSSVVRTYRTASVSSTMDCAVNQIFKRPSTSALTPALRAIVARSAHMARSSSV